MVFAGGEFDGEGGWRLAGEFDGLHGTLAGLVGVEG